MAVFALAITTTDMINTTGNKVGLLLAEAQQLASGVTVGNNTTLGSSVTVGNNASIAENTRIAQGASIGDDTRVSQGANIAENTRIANGANIGENAAATAGGGQINGSASVPASTTIPQSSPGEQNLTAQATPINIATAVATPSSAVCDADGTVTLEGTVSPMVPITARWEQTGGEPDVDIIGSGALISIFAIPACDEIDGDTTLTFRLTVIDAQGITDVASVDFVVTDAVTADDEEG
jgi:carbonic anhydrase/acetyltransferase-like protein (isoleucine patch superfamily)